MPTTFEPFTFQHLAAVICGLVVVVGCLFAGRRGGLSRRLATAFLVFLNLSAYPIGLAAWLNFEGHRSLDNLLPLQLCDVAAITAGFALLTRRPLLASLTYFWGLGATLQALLTPAITVGFPHWPFITFFTHHFAVVAAAVYLPVVEGWRPKSPFWRSPVEVYGWSVLYLGFAMLVNHVLDTNFAFASRPPLNPSLIDHLGPWPWYLVAMLCIALVLYLLLALPFRKGK